MADKSFLLSARNLYETLAVSWPTVLDAALGRVKKEVCDTRLARWSTRVVANAGIDLDIRGREHLRPGQTWLVMSNHQSLYDIPVLFAIFGRNIRMITKKELFYVPIFGGAMREAGFIEIDRANRKRAMESLEVARQKLRDGTHVWIAPEGTRSLTGALLPFKKGGFQLALETQWPIMPVTLNGTRNVLRAKGVRSVRNVRVEVTLHPPVDPSAYTTGGKAGRERLSADVRRLIESAL